MPWNNKTMRRVLANGVAQMRRQHRAVRCVGYRLWDSAIMDRI